MNRIIKFRAWDEVAKKYLYPWPDGFFILGETTCFNMIGMQLKERNPEKTILEKLNDVRIEQFIGHQDIDDVDIYEGDIVSKQGAFIVWDNRLACWSFDFKGSDTPPTPLFHDNSWREGKIKVYGNCRENPALLENK